MNSRNASSIVFLLIKCNNVSDRIGLIAADKMVENIKPSNLQSDFRKVFQGIFMESFRPITVEELFKTFKDMGKFSNNSLCNFL